MEVTGNLILTNKAPAIHMVNKQATHTLTLRHLKGHTAMEATVRTIEIHQTSTN